MRISATLLSLLIPHAPSQVNFLMLTQPRSGTSLRQRDPHGDSNLQPSA